jgi:DNA-binding response OmpR family regulator
MSLGKVYVIDDDENALRLAQRSLEKAGYEVQTTTRVIGTTSAINEFAPDVILLDVMMPALTGDKFLRLLRQGIRNQPRIILFSNKSEEELRKLAETVGADDFIPKIHGPAAILRKVSEHVKKRAQDRAAAPPSPPKG